MKKLTKRLLSFLLVLCMVGAMFPILHTQAEAVQKSNILTDEDYASADTVFAQIQAMKDTPAKKNASETALADEAEAIVRASESYVEGSLERNGDYFTWWTVEGIRCVYSPRMQKIQQEMTAPEDPLPDGAYNEPVLTKGGSPAGNQVYLIGPYYGSDSNFTDQYKNEAKAIAEAIGDTDGYTLYSGTAATVDKVAEAVTNGAVVIFDSHGTTDYESGDDYVTGANNSYLCLETQSGMTTEDYNDGAMYGSGYAYINGETIANHMTGKSQSGIVWMAICLGMATDTLCDPLRENGVEVVYGYSQSVSFAGDYLYEECFWDHMCAGDDVATSVAAMKSQWGDWDWSTTIATYYGYTDGYSTIAKARSNYAAFPVVVSGEDAHPGQRKNSSNYGADSLQTVKSTYTLFTQYEISVQVNDTTMGTATVSGNRITAVPADGYFAQSAQVLSGTATVSQNGNTFVVSAQSDCTVEIQFAAKTPVTVSFSGANVASQSGYSGDLMTLPTADAPEGYTFLGWTASQLRADTTEKPDYYTQSFTPTGNTTLYALYSYLDKTDSSGTGDYVKVTSAPADWSGDYLIVYETLGYVLDSSLSALDAKNNYAKVTISDDTIPEADGKAYQFRIEAVDGGYSIQAANGKYIGGTVDKNSVVVSDSALENAISLDASGNATISNNNAYLRYNTSDSRFRYYKASSYTSQQPVALYVKDGSAGVLYYTATPFVCSHENTVDVSAVDASCTADGYTDGVYCNDCNSYISGHQVIPATGHSYGDWTQTQAPGCTTPGKETHTCGSCGNVEEREVAATGHSYGDWTQTQAPGCTTPGKETHTCGNCGNVEEREVTATGHDYVLSGITYTCQNCGDHYDTYQIHFSVPTGVSKVSSIVYTGDGITLPECGVPTGETEYTLIGWTDSKLTDSTEKPTVYAPGSTYSATSETTLYALYGYSVTEEGGNGDYVKVTSAPDDWSGEYLIVYEAKGYVLDSSRTAYDGQDNYKTVSISNNTISAEQGDAYKFTVESMTGGYSFLGTGGKYLGNNGKKISSGSSPVSSTLTMDGENVWINGTGSYKMYFNTSYGFRYYTSGNASILPITLYRKDGAGTVTYYTTEISATEESPVSTWNVALSDDIQVNFDLAETDTLLTLTVAGEAVNYTVAGNRVSVRLAATQLTDEISLSVARDGKTVSATYTVRQYCDSILADSDMSAYHATVKELLRYGSAAQTYFEYHTDALADSGLTLGQAAAIPETAPAMSVSGSIEGVKFYGTSLVYRSRIAVRLYFVGDVSGCTFTVGEQTYTPVTKDGLSYIEVSDILPQNLDAVITLTVAKADTESALTVAYSPMNYIVRMNGKGNTALQPLLIALYSYHAAAKALIAE